MNYNGFSTNEQRLRIAAFGFEKLVVPDCYDIRKAIEFREMFPAKRGDQAKRTLAFAVFIKAQKMAKLSQEEILQWIASSWDGASVIERFAASSLGMAKPCVKQKWA